MDEPTAALSAVEVDRLFRVAETLRESGVAVLFISHRLEEVFGLCQRVTVLRDGRLVLARELAGSTADDLVRAMVGRDLPERETVEQNVGQTVLEVERLTREGVFVDVSFEVRAGEIVALAGLVGAGRSEVARAIFGVDRYDAGTVTVNGRRLRRGSPTAAMAAGIGFVPEDRRQQGLVMELSIERNIALASLRRLGRFGFIANSTERGFAVDWAARLQIKYGRLANPVTSLSGGNQQKVVLAKWLARRPSLLIVDEPTRGIDVGTKAEVHRLLDELAAEGVAILMISSELPEVLRHRRPDPRDARGPARRRVRPRGGVRGDDRRGGDRPGRGGRRTDARPANRQAPRAWRAGPDDARGDLRRLVDLVFRIRAFGIVAVLALLVLVTARIQPRFLSTQELQFILVDTTIFALLAIGETIVVLTRNVDLSIGSVLGLSAFLSADLFGQHPGIPIPLVFLAGLGIGVACGIANGLLTTIGRVPSLVVTLAMLYIIRGIDILVVGGGQVVASSLPNSFIEHPAGDDRRDSRSWRSSIAVFVAIGAYYLRSFRSGRELYAIGSNPDAARLAGHPDRQARVHGLRGQRRDRRGRRRPLRRALRHDRLDRRHRLRVAGDRRGRRRRRRDLRRQRQRRRRGARRAAAEHDPLGPLRARRLAVLGPGDRRPAAARRDRARPRNLAAADRRAATEVSPWRLRRRLDEAGARRCAGSAALGWEFGLVLALVAIVLFGVSVSSQFLTSSNLFYLNLSIGEVAIMALPMTLIVVTGEIDLSVASMLGHVERARRRPLQPRLADAGDRPRSSRSAPSPARSTGCS